MHAEQAYLFRHALVRDAAYQLQMPSERARLHALAIDSLEAQLGGPPPDLELSPTDDMFGAAHALDPYASELAAHAELAHETEHADPRHGLAVSRLNRALRLYLHRAAEYAERFHRNQEAAALWRRLGLLLHGHDGLVCQVRACLATYKSGDGAAAEAVLSSLRDQAQAATDRELECLVLSKLTNVLRERSKMAEAQAAGTRSLEVARATGARLQKGIAQGNLGNLYRETGRTELAQASYERALAIFQETSSKRHIATALTNIAALFQVTSRGERAEQLYLQAIQLSREAGDRRNEGLAVGNIAIVHHDAGHFDLAERSYLKSLAIHREVGNRRSEGIVLGNLAGLYRESGQPSRAMVLYTDALAIHRELGNRAFEGAHLGYCSLCLLDLGRSAEAQAAWRQGTGILMLNGDTQHLARITGSMLKACAKAGVPPLETWSNT